MRVAYLWQWGVAAWQDSSASWGCTEDKHMAEPHIPLWYITSTCLSKDSLYTKIHYSKQVKKETNFWFCKLLSAPPIPHYPVLSWSLRKHAVDYCRIGNTPEEFPANCILLDKGNGPRKFGLGRKTRLEEQSELSDALSCCCAPPLLNGDHSKFRMGPSPLFSEPDLHKAPEQRR